MRGSRLRGFVLALSLGSIALAFGQARYAYDFGPPGSPVGEGYAAVTVDMNTREFPAYSPAAGYGFILPSGRMNSRDRGVSLSEDPALRDFVTANGDYTFKRDLPNGTYRVTAWVGDYSERTTTLTIRDGKSTLGLLDFKCAANEIKSQSIVVAVAGACIEVIVSDPANNTRVLNALAIQQSAPGSAAQGPSASATVQAPVNAVVFGDSAPPEPKTLFGTKRVLERLDRGLVAVPSKDGTLVSWRFLGTDPYGIAFDLYRDGKKLNASPLTGATCWVDRDGGSNSRYEVRIASADSGESAVAWAKEYLPIPLKKPEGGRSPDKVDYAYAANDASVGDLDGDGKYEIVLKWDPTNSKDNSQRGYTGEVFIDAYRMDGTFLWRISMGRNIRAGAHYTQIIVYDLDSDGKAEVVMRTADETVDAAGSVVGMTKADYRNYSGYILNGPEYLTVFEGATGKVLQTVDYDPARGLVTDWGDDYGNRVDRFLACVAYLDGTNPSLLMCRGYYTRSVLVAYDWKGGSLAKRWRFDSNDPGNEAWVGQGNHQISVADVDGDGRDEIVYGSMAIDDDGRGLYNAKLGHGDASHLGDLDPSRPGLEYYQVHEDKNGPYGLEYRDSATGALIWGFKTGRDTGRGLSADVDPNYPGEEVWAAGGKFFSAKGQDLGGSLPSSCNFAVWWDGDLQRELLDHVWLGDAVGSGVGKIDKWDWRTKTTVNLLTAEGTRSCNSTKGNPTLQADLFGDWREEVIWRNEASDELRIYSTPIPTEYRIRTLMHDPLYRLGIAWQNVAYNQPPHTSFYLGDGMSFPKPETTTEAIPAQAAIQAAPAQAKALPTLFIAGDSTAADGTPEATGWGKALPAYFDPERILIDNRARGGRSSKTFIAEGLWKELIAKVTEGDYVLIQFGHNDGGEVFTGKARASLPGLGREYLDGKVPDGTPQRARSFGYYLDKMIQEVSAKGATPIVLSLTIRNIWTEGKIEEGNGMFSEWSRMAAERRGAAFVDQEGLIREEYGRLGQEKVGALFPKDYVHTGPEGAEINASLAVAGLRALTGDPLGKYLSAKGRAVAPAPSAYAVDPAPPTLRPLPEPEEPDLPDLLIVGDSTVRNGWGNGTGDMWGWGDLIHGYFDLSKINVVNRALGGMSSRTYLTSGYWEAALAFVKPGGFVMMQFGHNDGSAVNDDSRARGTIRGTGELTEDIDNLLTKRRETVHTFGWYLRKFVRDAKAKGAIPLICSLVPRAGLVNGRAPYSDTYGAWAKEVAAQEGVGFIDLNTLVADRYTALGSGLVPTLFPLKETTHTNRAGAELNAECAIQGLKALKENPLAPYFNEKAAAVGER